MGRLIMEKRGLLLIKPMIGDGDRVPEWFLFFEATAQGNENTSNFLIFGQYFCSAR
jgi:hypothetical protein